MTDKPQFDEIIVQLIMRGELKQRMIDVLMQGRVDEWNRLRDSLRESDYTRHPEAGKRFGEIEYESLKGLDLQGFYLRGIDLDGFTVAHCLMDHAVLDDAMLTTTFIGCDLEGTSMRRCQGSIVLTHGNTITDTCFQGAKLQWSNFTGCCVRGINFNDADLTNAALIGTHEWSSTKRRGLQIDPVNRRYIAACLRYERAVEKRERKMLNLMLKT